MGPAPGGTAKTQERRWGGAGCRWVREAATDGTEKGERLNITEKK